MQPRLGLAHGQNHQFFDILRTALGIRIEITHGIQFVAKEFRTDGPVGSGGINVKNSAADSKLTGAFHHSTAAVAGCGQPGEQFVNGIFGSCLQAECGLQQGGGGHGPLAQGFPGKNLNGCLAGCQIEQLAQALLLPGTGDNSSVVKGQLTAGQNLRCSTEKALQLLLHTLAGHVILTDDHHRTIHFLMQRGNHMAAVDLSNAGDSSAFAAACGCKQLLKSGDFFQNCK